MYTSKDLPESTKQVIYKVGFTLYLAAIAILIVLASMSAGASQITLDLPMSDSDSLVDRGLGYYDGCIAAGKSSSKCETLAETYVSNLKKLVN